MAIIIITKNIPTPIPALNISPIIWQPDKQVSNETSKVKTNKCFFIFVLLK